MCIRDRVKKHPDIEIPIFGNGDIDSAQKAKLYKDTYGTDGIMIGRAAIGYPWIFREIKHFLATGEELAPPTLEERVDTCIEHFKFSLDWKTELLGIFEMRRHYTNYFKGIRGFKPTRMRLVESQDPQEIFEILDSIKQQFGNEDFV